MNSVSASVVGRILLVVALVCFLLAFAGISLSGRPLTDLGLAFLAAGLLL